MWIRFGFFLFILLCSFKRLLICIWGCKVGTAFLGFGFCLYILKSSSFIIFFSQLGCFKIKNCGILTLFSDLGDMTPLFSTQAFDKLLQRRVAIEVKMHQLRSCLWMQKWNNLSNNSQQWTNWERANSSLSLSRCEAQEQFASLNSNQLTGRTHLAEIWPALHHYDLINQQKPHRQSKGRKHSIWECGDSAK